MEPVGERCKRYACRCAAGLPLINTTGCGMNRRRGNHIAARASIVQTRGKGRSYCQSRVVTLKIVMDTTATCQASPGIRKFPVLLLQVCKGFVSEFPRVVVYVHIQHHKAAASCNSEIVITSIPPPTGNLAGVCGGVLAAVGGDRRFPVAGEYPQAHVLCIIFSVTL